MKKIFYLVLVVLLFFFLYLFINNTKNTDKFEPAQLEKVIINENNNRYNIFPAVVEAYKNKKPLFNIEEIRNKDDKEKYDEKVRDKITELMNIPFTSPESPERDAINQVDMGKYIQKKIEIYTSSATRSYAYLLVPKNITFPSPAILAMHQHDGFYEYGKDEVAGNAGNKDLFYGKELAERGYVVLAIDAPLFGENKATISENSPEVLEDFSVRAVLVYGHSPLGLTFQGDLSALNYLYSLKNIDKNKIGCIGHSFGGTRCMYLAALDDRIKATVISNAVANQRPNYTTGIFNTWLTLLPGVAKYVKTNGILALISPRPLMVIYSENDPIFPKEETETQLKPLNELYSRLDNESNFVSLFIPNASHAFPTKYHEQAYEFFDKYLKN